MKSSRLSVRVACCIYVSVYVEVRLLLHLIRHRGIEVYGRWRYTSTASHLVTRLTCQLQLPAALLSRKDPANIT